METPKNPDPIDENRIRAWCEQAKQGDELALETLLCVYHPRLLGVARHKVGIDWRGKIEAEDLVQEALVEIVRAIRDFEYQGEDSFYRWSARIVDNKFIDSVRRLRRAKRDIARETTGGTGKDSRYQALIERCSGEWLAASGIVRRKDAHAAAAACIAGLPEHYRDVLTRIYLDEQPIAEAAHDLGKSEEAVRRMAGRALDEVRRRMGRLSRHLSRL